MKRLNEMSKEISDLVNSMEAIRTRDRSCKRCFKEWNPLFKSVMVVVNYDSKTQTDDGFVVVDYCEKCFKIEEAKRDE